jgi:HEAT repeat protein
MRALFVSWLMLFSLGLPVLGGSAMAGPAFVWMPRDTGAGETYVPVYFNASGSAASAIADEALKKLVAEMPEVAAIAVRYDAFSAELTIEPAKLLDAAVADRALGAVFHTLRGVGFDEVRLPGRPLSGADFTRGAFSGVHPIGAAIAQKVAGWVDLAGTPVPAAEFYKRLEAGDKDVQAAMKTLLERGSPDVRILLTERIESLKIKDHDGLVIPRLEDPDARVRLAAIRHFQRSPSPNALKSMATLVDKDTDNGVRLAAVKVLVASGKKEYERYLLLDQLNAADASVVIDAAKGLAASRDKKFMAAIAGLGGHANPQVRETAVGLLADAGEFALLASMVGNDQLTPDVRERAARRLADGAEGAQKAAGLSWLVQSGTTDNALYAAKKCRDEVIIGTAVALGKALARTEVEVRKTAAEALGKLKDPVGLEPLAVALRAATDPSEKEHYANQASAIIAVQPVDQAIAIASSSDATIRELAIRALAAFSKDKPNAKVNDVLRKALSASEPGTRQAAAFALARINDDGILADLVKLEGDADPEIRAQVAVAIGRSKVAAHDALLIKYLDDQDNRVKEAALVAVQAKKLAAAQDKVRFLVANRKVEVRREAMKALVLIAKPADPALFDTYGKAMQDEDVPLRMSAIDGLVPYADGRAAQYIGLPLLDDRSPKELKMKVIKALGVLGTADAVEHAVRGLFDEDREVKLATLDALATLKSDKAQRPLQEFWKGEQDAEVKARADEVLKLL